MHAAPVLPNLLAGMGDGAWSSSRAGVVVNPSPLGVLTNPHLLRTTNHSANAPTLATNLVNNMNAGLAFNSLYSNTVNTNSNRLANANNLENVLLSPQHFMTTSQDSDAGINNTVESDGGLLQNGNLNPYLLNMDLSASEFANVVNFDELMANGDVKFGDSDIAGHKQQRSSNHMEEEEELEEQSIGKL